MSTFSLLYFFLFHYLLFPFSIKIKQFIQINSNKKILFFLNTTIKFSLFIKQKQTPINDTKQFVFPFLQIFVVSKDKKLLLFDYWVDRCVRWNKRRIKYKGNENQPLMSFLRISKSSGFAIFPSPFLSIAWMNWRTYWCETCLFLPRLLKASFIKANI